MYLKNYLSEMIITKRRCVAYKYHALGQRSRSQSTLTVCAKASVRVRLITFVDICCRPCRCHDAIKGSGFSSVGTSYQGTILLKVLSGHQCPMDTFLYQCNIMGCTTLLLIFINRFIKHSASDLWMCMCREKR